MTQTTQNTFVSEAGPAARIRIVRAVWYNRAGTMDPLAEGQEYDVDAAFATSVCGDGRAERIVRK